ncbi:MAG: hypothetical protein ACNA8P_00325 [Phycisphaerales bacterium]
MMRLAGVALGMSAIGWCAPPVLAQSDRPSAANRLVKTWDFEDRIVNGFISSFPQDWYSGNPVPPHAERAGFPFWNEPGFSTAHAVSGESSLRLPTRGGSTSVRLARSALVVMPGSDYLITTMVRTDGLTHGRARVAAQYVRSTIHIDPQTGDRLTGYEPIPQSRVVSPLLLSDGEWKPVQIRMDAHPEAEFLEIELLLLQPEQFLDELRHAPEAGTPESRNPAIAEDPRSRRLVHEVIREDRSGSVSFDDVSVYQMPRLELRTTTEGNFVTAPTEPELILQVMDLTGEPLTASLRVYDLDGEVVSSGSFRGVELSAALRWSPQIERYGWYRATLDVHNPEGLVAQAFTQFVYLPPAGTLDREQARRFGLVAEDLRRDQLELLPRVVHALRTGAIWINIWGDDELGAGIGARQFGGAPSAFETAIDRLLEARQDITFVLGGAPLGVVRAAGLDQNATLDLFERDTELWGGSLEPLLTRYGERVARWQIAPTGDDGAFWKQDAQIAIDRVTGVMRRLVPRPTVVIPWMATHAPPRMLDIAQSSDGANQLTVVLAPEVSSEAISELAKFWPKGEGLALVIQSPDRDLYGRRANSIDLTKRAALAWHAGISRLAIESPWVWREARDASHEHDGLMPYDGQWLPEVEAAVWRTLSQSLATQEPAGEFRTGGGTRVLIGRPRGAARGSGVLIAWNEHATPSEAVLRAYLADGPVRAIDPFGNTTIIEPVDGLHEVHLGQMPVIIEGINAELSLFRAGLRVEPGFVPSRAMRHELELVVNNPYTGGISGRIRFSEPHNWNFTPRVLHFSARRGEELRLPFTIELGIGEEAGPRTIHAELELTADKAYPIMRIPLRVELGLEDVVLTPSSRLAPGPDGRLTTVIVEALVTNTSQQSISLEATATAPGFPGQSAPISSLEPGDSVVKRFVFLNASEALRGKRVRVSLREQNGSGRINRTLDIP